MSDPRALPEVLAEVVTQFGRRIVDRPAQLRAALSDTLGADSARDEVTAAIAASTAGIASAIRDADPSEPASAEQIRQWFDQLTAAGLSLRDAALATASWATAFNAHPTAQRTSELAADDSGTADSSRGRTEPAADPAADLDERTRVGDIADRTEAAALPPTTAPAPEPPVWDPPTGAPVQWLDAAPRHATTGASWLRPAAVIAGAAVLGVGVAVAATALRGGPAADTAGGGSAAVDGRTAGDAELLGRGDLHRFLLTEEELQTMTPAGDVMAMDPFMQPEEYRSIPAAENCEPMLAWVPPETDGSTQAVAVSSWTENRSVYLSARAYASAGEAAEVFDDLLAADGCGEVTIAVAEGPYWSAYDYEAEFEVLASSATSFVDRRTDFDNRSDLRTCNLRANVVSCWLSSGDDEVEPVQPLDGDDLVALAADRADRAMP